MSKSKSIVEAAAIGFKKQWPKIAVGLGAGLFVLGGYLLGKEVPKYKKAIKQREEDKGEKLKSTEKAKMVVKHFGPAACAIAGGALSIVASVCETDKRIAVGTTAVAVSEVATKNLTDYVAAAKDVVGEEKEKEIKKKVKEKKIAEVPAITVPPENGKYWCYDLVFDGPDGKPFMTTENELRAAENEGTRRMLCGDDVTLNEIYEMIGHRYLEVADAFGWRHSLNKGDRVDLEISSIIKDGMPVFTISPTAAIIDPDRFGIPDYGYYGG